MRSRLLILILLLSAPLWAACGGDQDKSEVPLLRLLSFIPDTPEYRQYLTYGDADAWHTSWNIPRIDNLEELDSLDRESRAYWMFIMGNQTTPPNRLGGQYLFSDDYRGCYGFDLFNADRFVDAGMPREGITVVEFSFDQARIAEALIASGYESEALAEGGTLYSINADYEMDFEAPTHAGKMGDLNRIALLDGQMIMAKATANVTNALLAHSGQLPSLAENPAYVAAARALEDAALKETGELVGVILMEGAQFYAIDALLGSFATPELVEAIRARYAGQGPRLPGYTLVAFATRHTEGASYLILAVVFPAGADADEAADVLTERLQSYESLRTLRPLDDYWTFEKATAVEAEGLPVALVVMRADDPPPTPENESRVNSAVFSWMRLVVYQDLLFLTIE